MTLRLVTPVFVLLACLPLAGLAEPAPASRPIVIAHRGASASAPENTVAAARLGFEMGADAVEIDIWLTADGEIAVIHDATTKRTTGTDGNVREMNLADLRKLDAGSWMNARFADERIPSLDQILESRSESGVIVIEIKDTNPALLPALEASLKRTQTGPASAVLIAFDFDTLKAARARLPDYPCYWIVGYPSKKGATKVSVDELIDRAKSAGFKGLNLNNKWPINSAFAEKVHSAGLQLFVWTVNSGTEIRQLVLAGVDGITTDSPDRALSVVNELRPLPR